MRIRMNYYTDPDYGSGNSSYGSKSVSRTRFQIQSQFFPQKQGCGSALIFCGSGSSCLKMRIRIRLRQIYKKITLWRVFFSCKKHKRLLISKKHWRLCRFTLKTWINLQLLPIFLNFFCFYLTIFPSWIRIRIRILNAEPDPQFCPKVNFSHTKHVIKYIYAYTYRT